MGVYPAAAVLAHEYVAAAAIYLTSSHTCHAQANELLARTKGQAMGWGAVALGFAFAFAFGKLGFNYIR